MADKDYYKILGVEPDASEEEIKKVYRQLAREFHPDHGGDEGRFKEISEAYTTVSDPQKRQEYDFRRAGGGGNPFAGMGDIFGFGNPFGFNRQRPDPNRPMRGQDIRYVLEVGLKYFIFGGNLSFDITHEDTCSTCAGSGALESDSCGACGGSGQVVHSSMERGMHMMHAVPCAACGGHGRIIRVKCDKCNGGTIQVTKQIHLDIPKNIKEGHVIVKTGEGLRGRNAGPNGDLAVRLSVRLPREEELTSKQAAVLRTL